MRGGCSPGRCVVLTASALGSAHLASKGVGTPAPLRHAAPRHAERTDNQHRGVEWSRLSREPADKRGVRCVHGGAGRGPRFVDMSPMTDTPRTDAPTRRPDPTPRPDAPTRRPDPTPRPVSPAAGPAYRSLRTRRTTHSMGHFMITTRTSALGIADTEGAVLMFVLSLPRHLSSPLCLSFCLLAMTCRSIFQISYLAQLSNLCSPRSRSLPFPSSTTSVLRGGDLPMGTARGTV